METPSNARPELKPLLGALILAARRPLALREIRRLLEETPPESTPGDVTSPLAALKEREIREALEALANDLKAGGFGFWIEEGPEGFRFKTDPRCGPWVRRLLDAGRGQRLSRPALETLAIIAWRQPITRADIEAIRGVSVDHVLRLLLELQLVRIVGRSELPGRPLLYGTTTCFLEHFGLKDLSELPRLEELARLDTVRRARESETDESEKEAERSPTAEPSATDPMESAVPQEVGGGKETGDTPPSDAASSEPSPEPSNEGMR